MRSGFIPHAQEIHLGLAFNKWSGSAAVVEDGRLLQTLTLNRQDYLSSDLSFSENLILKSLAMAKLLPGEVGRVLIADPFSSGQKKSPTFDWFSPGQVFSQLMGLPKYWSESLFLKTQLEQEVGRVLSNIECRFIPEDIALSAFSYFSSGYRNSAILVAPADQEKNLNLWLGHSGIIDPVWSLPFNSSLDAWLLSICHFFGLSGAHGVHQFLNLAEMGEPNYLEEVGTFVVSNEEDGRILLNEDLIAPALQTPAEFAKWQQLLGHEPLQPELTVGTKELDLAKSFSTVFLHMIDEMARKIRANLGCTNLSILGHSVASSFIKKRLEATKVFDHIHFISAEPLFSAAMGASLYSQVKHPFVPRQLQADFIHSNELSL